MDRFQLFLLMKLQVFLFSLVAALPTPPTQPIQPNQPNQAQNPEIQRTSVNQIPPIPQSADVNNAGQRSDFSQGPQPEIQIQTPPRRQFQNPQSNFQEMQRGNNPAIRGQSGHVTGSEMQSNNPNEQPPPQMGPFPNPRNNQMGSVPNPRNQQRKRNDQMG